MALFLDLETFLGRVMGQKNAHHVLLRYCSQSNKTLDELSKEDIPELGNYLRNNLSFFVGHTRAMQVSQAFLTIIRNASVNPSGPASPLDK